MAKRLTPNDQMLEDDYIDMDISSATFLCCSKSSPPSTRDFEFKMSVNLPQRESTSPADELFYKGKLLPLHLPPCVQMVQKLLKSSTKSHEKHADSMEDSVASATPFESCKISPGELVQSHSKKFWSKKIKIIKQSSISLKLNASRAYLQSLFMKSGCSGESKGVPKAKYCSTATEKLQKDRWFMMDMNATTLMKSIEREKLLEEKEYIHRNSFSGAINYHLITRSSSPAISSCSSSSSFSSVSSSGMYRPMVINRSSSVNTEMESSIQGAIAYCKRSQVSGRKSVSDLEFSTLSISRIAAAYGNKERPAPCRG